MQQLITTLSIIEQIMGVIGGVAGCAILYCIYNIYQINKRLEMKDNLVKSRGDYGSKINKN